MQPTDSLNNISTDEQHSNSSDNKRTLQIKNKNNKRNYKNENLSKNKNNNHKDPSENSKLSEIKVTYRPSLKTYLENTIRPGLPFNALLFPNQAATTRLSGEWPDKKTPPKDPLLLQLHIEGVHTPVYKTILQEPLLDQNTIIVECGKILQGGLHVAR